MKHVLKLGATVHYSIWGRQNQKEAPKVLQKLLKAWQKTSLYYFFFDAFFFEADSEAGRNCSLFSMGNTKPERSPESVAKATKSMAKKLVCIIFF